MATIINKNAVKTIVCLIDNSEPKFEFIISVGMSMQDRLALMDIFVDIENEKEKTGKSNFQKVHNVYLGIVRNNLRGVKYMPNVSHSQWDKVPDDVMEQLEYVLLPNSGYFSLIDWLGGEIWNATVLSEEEKKT